jgi:hypothetical protein
MQRNLDSDHSYPSVRHQFDGKSELLTSVRHVHHTMHTETYPRGAGGEKQRIRPL